MKIVQTLFCVLLSGLLGQSVLAAQLIKVGAYNFPPYVIQAESEQPQGLLADVLAALNQQQSDYRFVMVPTSVTRRYRDFQSARIDIMLFESPTWGWQDTPMSTLDLHVEDAEIYVAKAEPGRGQEFFAQFKGKRLALYSGYHYGFANFNADPEFLAREYNARLSYSHESNLLMVQRGRADITIVARSYLHSFETMYPEQRGQFLLSTAVDQRYQHMALLRPQAPISTEVLEALVEKLRSQGTLAKLCAQYQLTQTLALGKH